MLSIGSRIEGKWTRERFDVIQGLGAGANGEVYLVRNHRGNTAMKICDRAGDIAFEWGLLEKLDSMTKCFPKPILIDDDATGRNLYFYVMECISGTPLSKEFSKLKSEQVYGIFRNILVGLGELHRTGHAFCDIKPQNILVMPVNKQQVRFVDVGGVTPFGRSVRQFTPYYDRAYWGLGTRTAEQSYDLIGLVLVFVCLATPPPASLSNRSDKERRVWLNNALLKFPYPAYIPVFKLVLNGTVKTSDAFLKQIDMIDFRRIATKSGKPTQTNQPGKKHRDWTERLMWVSLGSAAVMTFAAWASFLGWL